MTDYLGIIIHGFHNAVIDTNIKISEDSFFMASEHPSRIPQGLQPAVSGPPACLVGRQEPPFEIFLCPGLGFVFPKFAEQFLEQIGPCDLQIGLEQMGKRNLLLGGQFPGIFQPYVFGPFQHITAYLSQCLGFHLPYFVNGIHKVADDVEFIKDNHSLPTILVNDIDIVLPHITTHTLNGCSILRPIETGHGEGVPAHQAGGEVRLSGGQGEKL